MNTDRSINLITPKSAAKILGTITIVLICANLFFNFIKYLTKDSSFYGLIPLFNLNYEHNIPSFFSGCLFLISAVFLIQIWKVKKHYNKPQKIWILLAFLFVFLAYDELFKVHELLIDPIRNTWHTTGLLYYAWFIVYGVGVLLLAVLFYPEWKRLNKKFQLLFSAAATTFMTGAIGFEMIGGAYYESINRETAINRGDVISGVLYTIEESLEMAGLLIFIYSLMLLLEKELDGAVLIVSEKEN